MNQLLGETKRMDIDHSKRELQDSYNAIFSSSGLKECSSYYKWIFRLLNLKTDDKLLDVACGAGFLLEMAENKGLFTYGLDFSSSALKIAAKNATSASLILSSGEKIPFRDETFDCVTCLGALEHFSSCEQGIREIRRVLKTDGFSCLVVPNLFFVLNIYNALKEGHGPTHGQLLERFLARGDWEELIVKNGLAVIETKKFNNIVRTPGLSLQKILYKTIEPFIPLNLSYHFVFICRKD